MPCCTTGSWQIGEWEEQMPDFESASCRSRNPRASGLSGFPASARPGSSPRVPEKPDAAAALIDFLFSPEAVETWIGGSRYFVPVEADLSNLELGPLYQQVIDTLQSAEEEGVQFGYNVDVLAPPEFNDMMFSGFQAILVGDKTPEQQAADLQAAWEEGWREGRRPRPVTRCTARAG